MYADGRRTSTRQLCLSHRAAGVLTVLPVGLQYHLQISRSPVPKLPSLRVEPRQRRRVGDDSELRKQFSQPRLPRPCCHKFATHPFHIATPSQPFPCGGVPVLESASSVLSSNRRVNHASVMASVHNYCQFLVELFDGRDGHPDFFSELNRVHFENSRTEQFLPPVVDWRAACP